MYVRYLIGMINYLDYKYSKGKGATPAGKSFASSINMGQSDMNYTSDYVDGEKLLDAGSTKTIPTGYKLAWAPVYAIAGLEFNCGSDTVLAKLKSDGSLDFTGAIGDTFGSGTTGTLNPVTGALTLTVAGEPKAPVTVSYHFNNEDVRSDGPDAAGFTNVPEIELQIKNVPVEARARTLRSFWSFDAAYELSKELTSKVA